MTTAWHYTTGQKFLQIAETGFILPADIGVKPPERPIVWFSLAPHFELTARKAWQSASGLVRGLSIQETRELGGGLVRFGVDVERLIPWKGGELRKTAKMSAANARKLEKEAIKQGANPFEWLGSLDAVTIGECEIQVMGEAYKNGAWIHIAEAVEWMESGRA